MFGRDRGAAAPQQQAGPRFSFGGGGGGGGGGGSGGGGGGGEEDAPVSSTPTGSATFALNTGGNADAAAGASAPAAHALRAATSAATAPSLFNRAAAAAVRATLARPTGARRPLTTSISLETFLYYGALWVGECLGEMTTLSQAPMTAPWTRVRARCRYSTLHNP
jgi:hypothetical protein